MLGRSCYAIAPNGAHHYWAIKKRSKNKVLLRLCVRLSERFEGETTRRYSRSGKVFAKS
jgi:hypothetical protein